MMKHSADMSIITSIVCFARALHPKLLTNGIESKEQADRLLGLGCDQGQGYLLSPPVPLERTDVLIAR